MSAVLHSFHVKLSKAQAAEIRKQFQSAKVSHCAMIAQPRTDFPPFQLTNPSLEVVVLDKELTDAMHKIIREHVKARPRNQAKQQEGK